MAPTLDQSESEKTYAVQSQTETGTLKPFNSHMIKSLERRDG